MCVVSVASCVLVVLVGLAVVALYYAAAHVDSRGAHRYLCTGVAPRRGRRVGGLIIN